MSTLWTEKYRPSRADELAAPEHIKRFLSHALANGHPHLLLYGPPGTGKTTFASMLRPTLSLNASDERGIDVVRNKIKKIANTMKKQVIILDECENLSRDSQTCLRRILEDFPNTTFIFCTNYYNRIINPLKSRLLKFKFVARDPTVLAAIGEKEGIRASAGFYDRLFLKCDRDLRKCINALQGMKPFLDCAKSRDTAHSENISNEDSCSDTAVQALPVELDDIIGRVPDQMMDGFYDVIQSNHKEYVAKMVTGSYSVLQLVRQLSESMRGTDAQKCRLALLIAECEAYSVGACSDELVLNRLCVGKLAIYC